jgi:hypothetical protein
MKVNKHVRNKIKYEYFFIYLNLFYYSVNLDCTTSNIQMTVNNKLERTWKKESVPRLQYYSGIRLYRQPKTQKDSVKMCLDVLDELYERTYQIQIQRATT